MSIEQRRTVNPFILDEDHVEFAAGPSATYDDRFDAQTLVKADALAN
ncbi:hypothetical protein [Nocardia sp. NPDC004123]